MALSWLKPPIRDDRGNAVELLLTRTEGCGEWPVSGDERIERLRERLEGALGRPTSIPMLPQVVALAFVLAMFIFMAWISPSTGLPRIIWLFFPAMIALVIGLGLASRWFVGARQARIAQDFLLQEGLCPGCGYNLVGLGPERDHMVVCPECGGAWRELRIVRAAPFVKGAPMGPALPRVSWSWPGMRARRFDFDDRNKQVRLLPPRLRRMRAMASSEAHGARLEAAADRMTRTGRGTRVAMASTVGAFGVVVGLIIAYVAWHHNARGPGTYAMMIGVPSLAFGIIGVVLLSSSLTLFERDIIDAMKGEGLCPSCGAMLDVMRPAEDGCVECPACGAAWRARGIASSGAEPRS